LKINRPPFTEEQIRTHTIGELKPLASRILIVDYDPQWPTLFERETPMPRRSSSRRSLHEPAFDVGSTNPWLA
jgi:GrpB-like predicted nucleotidyltransferase (UPF0157 family)